MKKFLMLLLLSLALTGCGGEESKVGDRAETFIREVISGDANKAAAMVVPPEKMPEAMKGLFQQKLTAIFKAMQEAIKGQGSLKSVKAKEVKFENGDKTAALVTLEVVVQDAKKDREETNQTQMHMVKKDGQWFIDKLGHLE